MNYALDHFPYTVVPNPFLEHDSRGAMLLHLESNPCISEERHFRTSGQRKVNPKVPIMAKRRKRKNCTANNRSGTTNRIM